MSTDRALQSEAAAQIAARAIVDLIEQHQLQPTPANYEFWFAHQTGANAELSAAINRRIATGGVIDDAFCTTLFERHLSRPVLSAAMIEASEKIAHQLSGAVSALRSGGQGTSAYAAALAGAATAFETEAVPDGLRSLVKGLASATHEMARRNEELTEKMLATSREVDELQTSLRHVTIEALTDGLTGLANRKAFDQALEQSISETSSELCLLLCDIDHFKRFNDTWGHQVGDQVIRYIAQVLKQHAGGEFLAARYGGEEFAIIMPRTNMHRAQAIAGSIRQAVKAKKLTRKSTGEVMGAVALSMGIARRRAGDGSKTLIGRADQCLYASKQGGRDRITIDSDLPRETAA